MLMTPSPLLEALRPLVAALDAGIAALADPLSTDEDIARVQAMLASALAQINGEMQ